MAQRGTNNNNAPAPVTNPGIMGSGENKNGNKGFSQATVTGAGGSLQVDAATDKGKGVAGGNGQERRAEGKNSADAAVVAGKEAGGSRRGRSRETMHILAERERRSRIKEMFTNLHALVPNLPAKVDKASIVGNAIGYIKNLEETLEDLQRRKMERDRLARAASCGGGGDAGSSSSAAPAPTAVALAQVAVAHGGSKPAPSQAQAVLPVFVSYGAMSCPAPAATAPPAGAVVAAAPAMPAPGTFLTWSGPNVVLNLVGDDAFINVRTARVPGVLTMTLAVLDKHGIDVVTAQITSDASWCMFTVQTRLNRESNPFGQNVSSEEIYQLAVSEIIVWLSS